MFSRDKCKEISVLPLRRKPKSSHLEPANREGEGWGKKLGAATYGSEKSL